MAVHHPGLQMEIADLQAMIRRMAVQTFQNAAIGSAGMRVYDGGWITIENGGLSVSGQALISGLLDVTGRLEGSGTLDWTGPFYLRGTGLISGNLAVTGATALHGAVTLSTSLSVAGSGYVEAGTVRMDRFGPYGGRVWSSGSVLQLGAGSSVLVDAPYLTTKAINATSIDAFTLDVQGAKNFKIPHPTRQDHYLRHGSTESPVSGVEYPGVALLDDAGEAVVELPPYFEGLAKLAGRTVQVTPVGRPFQVGADLPENGRFTVYGAPGREVSYLVKAERRGADFVLEEPVYGPLREGNA